MSLVTILDTLTLIGLALLGLCLYRLGYHHGRYDLLLEQKARRDRSLRHKGWKIR